MNYTPDTLRAIADGHSDLWVKRGLSEMLHACADAWKELVADHEAFLIHHEHTMEEWVDCRQRLEASEEGRFLAEALVLSHEGHIAILEKRLVVAEKVVLLIRAWREKPYTMSAETVIDLIEWAFAAGGVCVSQEDNGPGVEEGEYGTLEPDYKPDGSPRHRPARWIRDSVLNPDVANRADSPDRGDR